MQLPAAECVVSEGEPSIAVVAAGAGFEAVVQGQAEGPGRRPGGNGIQRIGEPVAILEADEVCRSFMCPTN